MRFTITFRDPRVAGFAGASIVSSEFQAREALERLRRQGYEVTGTEPPLAERTPFPAAL
jgi:hypothetical protein